MADISKINGLNLKDAEARSDIAGMKDGTIPVINAYKTEYYYDSLAGEEPIEKISTKFNTIEKTIQDVANGVCKGYSFNSIDTLIGALEAETSNTKYKIGDEFYIKEKDKPDYWVAEVVTTKGAAVTSIEDGTTVGYWVLFKLGEKTDLTLYQTKEDSNFATVAKTVTGAVNEVKRSATTNFTYISEIIDGTQPVGKAGQSDEASKAEQDGRSQNIAETYIKGLSVSGKVISYTKGNGATGTITTQDTVYTLPPASESELGGIAVGYVPTDTRDYPVKISQTGNAYVEIPWTDTKYTLPAATTTVRGGGKVGAVANATVQTVLSNVALRSYPVQRDTNEVLFVNVPWEQYAAATQSVNGLMSAADKKKLDHIAISVSGEEMTITLA